MKQPSANHTAPAGILYRAPVYGASGYADENLLALMELDRRGVPVQLLAEGQQSDSKKLLPADMRRRLAAMQQARVDPARGIFYQCVPGNAFSTEIGGLRNIGRTTFETDRIPDGWAERCSEFDEVWVPSEFNRETFARAGVEECKLRVMPEGIDTELFRPGLDPLEIPERRAFTFLSVFDWQQRKGYDVLLRAWTAEFRADEDVALVLKITTINQPWLDIESILAYFLERELGVALENIAPIILLNGLIPRLDFPRLYAAADAFVLPTRGEGWGRPYGEALACECPVIATRWGGQLDFLDDSNSDLIDVEGILPAPPNLDLEIFAGHKWAEPSVDHLRQLMRRVASHPDQAVARARKGRRDMVEKWDGKRIASLFAEEFVRQLDAISAAAAAPPAEPDLRAGAPSCAAREKTTDDAER
jgi:glycosyltransferase involved in cell wall biosynthesis